MKIKFFVETNWPQDKRRVRSLDGVDWLQTVDFPLLPRVGDMILLNADDDYREVEQVMLSLDGGELSIDVQFKFLDQGCEAKKMRKAGWVEL